MIPKISIITPAKVRAKEEYGWLHEAIQSVQQQSYDRWEMVIVDDASNVDISRLQAETEDDRIRWYHTRGLGAATARNHAATQARGELLLPLDADDKLAPNALNRFFDVWQAEGHRHGIVYSDLMMFGENWTKYFEAPEYDFGTLLRNTYMSIGCLHRRAIWSKSEGWRIDMEGGLEDWEYWIHLGEMGVCGLHIPEPLYWYRQNPRGRLRYLKEDQSRFAAAFQKLRSLHQNTYGGNWPLTACSGRRTQAQPQATVRPPQRVLEQAAVKEVPVVRVKQPGPGDMVEMRYSGPKRGTFSVVGQTTRRRYRVPGAGRSFQVAFEDVPFFRSFQRGQHYQVMVPGTLQAAQHMRQVVPKEEPATVESAGAADSFTAPLEPPRITMMDGATGDISTEGFTAPLEPLPVMTDVPVIDTGGPELPDIESMSVRAIRELRLDPVEALQLLNLERTGKNRITAIRFLQGAAGDVT